MATSEQEYQKRIEALEAQLAATQRAAQAKQEKARVAKLSEKSGVSLYGIRRFPVTFYVEEWANIAGSMHKVVACIKENWTSLARKDNHNDDYATFEAAVKQAAKDMLAAL